MLYAELVTAVSNYMENTFATADMNNFIELAEQRIFNSVQFPALRRNVTGATTGSNPYLTCPTDFLAPYSMAAVGADGRYNYLLNKEVNFIREAYPSPTSVGLPKYYAMFGPSFADPPELSFILGPTPDAIYTIELHYFFYPESITTAPGGQTWLGDNFDSVLLYGSLVEAYRFLKGEADLLAVYDATYKEALALAKKLGNGMSMQDQYRSGSPRMPVS